MAHELDNISPEDGAGTGDAAIGEEGGNRHLFSMQFMQGIYNELTGKSEELSREAVS